MIDEYKVSNELLTEDIYVRVGSFAIFDETALMTTAGSTSSGLKDRDIRQDAGRTSAEEVGRWRATRQYGKIAMAFEDISCACGTFSFCAFHVQCIYPQIALKQSCPNVNPTDMAIRPLAPTMQTLVKQPKTKLRRNHAFPLRRSLRRLIRSYFS